MSDKSKTHAEGWEDHKPGKQVLVDKYHPNGDDWLESAVKGKKGSRK